MAVACRVPVRIDFDADPPVILWQRADGAPFVEPFFDETCRRLRTTFGRTATCETPLDRWSDAGQGEPPAVTPDAVIFHVSRCGSTLVSRMLASLPSTLVISEAPVFDDILRGAPRHGVDPAMRVRWMRHALAAFAASQAIAPARLIVKLDCWHLFEIACVRRAFPAALLLFVYRDPLEVLVSLMAQPSWTLVRDTVTPGEIGIAHDQRDALSREELAAAILGAFFRVARQSRDVLVPVPYTSLPGFVWSDLARMTRTLAFTPGDVARLRDAASRDAKQPRDAFVPDAARKRGAATVAMREACTRWAEPAYQDWLASV